MEIRTLLKASSEARNLKLTKTIHAHLLISSRLTRNHVVEKNHLLNCYSKCGDIRAARKLFDEMRKRNIVSWGTMMAAYSNNHLQVVGLCRDMVRVDKLCPNKYILATVVSCCSNFGLVDLGRQCHGYALVSGLVYHQYVKNALVNLYSGDLRKAMYVLDSSTGSDICAYNSVLSGVLNQGGNGDAFEVLRRMVSECGCDDWDSITCVNVLGVCGVRKDLILGRQVYCRVVKTGSDSDHYIGSASIDMYGKCGEVLLARKVFNGLESRNVIVWTAMLNAYLQNECFEETVKLFLEMEFESVKPNDYTFAVVLNSCACLSAVGCGNALHARIEKIGVMNYTIVGNALIHMYSKCGLIDNSNTVFRNMIYRDIVSWNLMISGYSYHGLGKEALTLFDHMLAENEQPNYVTFVGVLSACSFLGRLNEGFYYLNYLMREFNIKAGVEHYTCIIGVLCRAGKLKEAEAFMSATRIEWDVVAYRTLLNACHVHRNYFLGKKVAKILLRMNPNDVGTYILISNIHARANRWDKVASIRKLMGDRSMKKEPGLSWTEIRNETHAFLSDDNEHVDAVKIREKVKTLLAEIKRIGYVPNFVSELHDVEEEQKEDQLSYHSEKLAIAFALLKTPSDAPIRVIKNLRMCDDCHSFAKFISTITNRKIIIRDANRFHRFEDGSCTCADYW